MGAVEYRGISWTGVKPWTRKLPLPVPVVTRTRPPGRLGNESAISKVGAPLKRASRRPCASSIGALARGNAEPCTRHPAASVAFAALARAPFGGSLDARD